MKKKLSLFVMIVLLIPVFALFGCGEASSYPVFVYTSSDPFGSVNGNGTYQEGTTVTLTASAKQDCHFVAWVYQNSMLIEDEEGYKITNTQNSNQKIGKSVLTFTMSDKNQGKYTAVFDKESSLDNKMMYAKLSTYRITSTPDKEGEEDDGSKSSIMTANSISIEHGQNSSNLVKVCEAESVDLKENVNVAVEQSNEVLKLSEQTKQHLKVSAVLTYKNKAMSLNLRADIGYHETTEVVETEKYSYQVKYADGTYKIIFGFKVAVDTKYYMVVEYENLSA